MSPADLELERQIALLQLSIHDILHDHPAGISEHALLTALEAQQQFGAERGVYDSGLTLFQCHFLLFHTLYRLRDQLLGGAAAVDIEIHCLNIRLIPLAGEGGAFPARHDPLRHYYLDLDNLRETTAGEVESLLNRFWQRYLAADGRGEALALLGLREPVSAEEIKAQYRSLVMEHHPDRGGDKEKLQQINRAMQQLKLLHP